MHICKTKRTLFEHNLNMVFEYILLKLLCPNFEKVDGAYWFWRSCVCVCVCVYVHHACLVLIFS